MCHGYYEVEDRSLKYLVVVRHGLPMGQSGSAKPGNRGERDSQLIIMGYFNRIYHGRKLSELDAAIVFLLRQGYTQELKGSGEEEKESGLTENNQQKLTMARPGPTPVEKLEI